MILDLISKKEKEVKAFNMGDKIGYALGDFGCAIFFSFVSSYLMVFYTDVMGIGAAAVGTLFVVARFWDAVNDPLMGILLDRSKGSKHGKFRPYIVIFGIVMVLAGILAFTAFPIPQNLKLPYAYVTYIIFGMSYTAVNIPYGSLSSVMTHDPNERTALSTFRNLGSMGANLLSMILVPEIIFNAQGEVTANGFITCAVILAVISVISFILSFRLTRERIVSQSNNNKKQNAGQTLGLILRNRAFIGVAVASFLQLGGMMTLAALNVYIFKDYFNAPHLTAFGGMIGMLASLVVIPFVGPIVKKLGKKEASVLGAGFATAMYIIMLLIPNLNVTMFIVLSCLAGFGAGLVSAITWALVSDTIDYQEYKSGYRNEGTVYSSYSLARKLGQVISGGMGGFALSALGYQSGAATQTASVGIGIKNIGIGMAAGGYLLCTLVLLFVFNLSKKRVAEMNDELSRRRKTA